MTPEAISCFDGCKRTVADVAEAEARGWLRLAITGRYRCVDCWRALTVVNGYDPKRD